LEGEKMRYKMAVLTAALALAAWDSVYAQT
jgi:hypothetical protein